jgi:hypothetical protein
MVAKATHKSVNEQIVYRAGLNKWRDAIRPFKSLRKAGKNDRPGHNNS